MEELAVSTIPLRYSKGWIYTSGLTVLAHIRPELEALLLEPGEKPAMPDVFDQLSADPAFVGCCLDLDTVHEDLDFLLYEMDTSFGLPYKSLADKRMTLVYHSDNFYLRVHAYREKVFLLLNRSLQLGHSDNDRRLREKVFADLRDRHLDQVNKLLNNFQLDPSIDDIFQLRKRLVHGLSKRDWKVISMERRFNEYFYESRAVDNLADLGNLTELHRLRQQEFGQVCARLSEFRDELVAALQVALKQGHHPSGGHPQLP
jgi:hypothetical protein